MRRHRLGLVTFAIAALLAGYANAANAAPASPAAPAPSAAAKLEQQLRREAAAHVKEADGPKYDGKALLPQVPPIVAPTRAQAGRTCSTAADQALTPAARYIMCVQPSSSKPTVARGPGGTGLRINGVTPRLSPSLSPDDLTDLPLFCLPLGVWLHDRSAACNIHGFDLTVVDAKTQLPVGTLTFVMLELEFVFADTPGFFRQIQFEVTGGTLEGLAPGTTISGTGTCLGLCTNVVTDFPTQPLVEGEIAGGQMTFLSGVTTQGQVAGTTSDAFFILNHIGQEGEVWSPVRVNAAANPPLIRCDNALPGVNQVGCVFPDRAPTLQYSRGGLFPQLARHIGDAQASGLPGAPGTTPLERLTNATDVRRNRRKACPPSSAGGYPRPATLSCDEYPFASTHQGAATAGDSSTARTFDWCHIDGVPQGVTGEEGFSVCMIDSWQNSVGGSGIDDGINTGLGAFYRKSRVLEGDEFFVEISGVGGDPNPNPPDFPPTANAGPDVTGFEGSPVDLVGSASDDHGPPAVHWSYQAGPDVDPGTVCFFGDDAAAITTIRCTDDGTFTVTISASDGVNDDPTTDSATVRLVNVPPQLRRNTADLVPGKSQAAALPTLGITTPSPWQVFRVGDPVTVTTNFEDPGTNDTQTCDLQWDDGTSSSGTVADSACGGTHVYTHAGMYTIRPSITDDDGGVSEPASVLVIVYDPNGGFSTEGGFFNSPAGALTADPSAADKLTLEFNPDYLPGDTGPTVSGGKVSATLHGAAFSLDSTTLDWLVVTSDNKVAVKGTGTVNGQPGYGFVAYGFNNRDKVRLVVWPLSSGPYPQQTLTYDNRAGADYDLDLSNPQPLDGGSLQIHD